jgi:chromosome segregation ATPase
MPPAFPQTATAADANFERKAILAEIAALTLKRDELRWETDRWEQARNAVQEHLVANRGLVLTADDVKDVILRDLHGKREELRKTVSGLQDAKDSLERDVKVAGASLLDLRDKETKLSARLAKTKADTESAIHIFNEHTRKANDHISSTSSQVEDLDKKLALGRIELQAIRKEVVDRNAKFMEEERRLATKARDLTIYETRIRKAAAEIGMDITI